MNVVLLKLNIYKKTYIVKLIQKSRKGYTENHAILISANSFRSQFLGMSLNVNVFS
jgi:hypothetical protein